MIVTAPVSERFKYLLDRGIFEFTRATDNIAWWMSKAARENKPELLDGDVIERLEHYAVEAYTDWVAFTTVVLREIFQCPDLEITRHTFNRRRDEVTVEFDDSYVDSITIPERETTYRRSEQFSDWVIKMFPDKTTKISTEVDGDGKEVTRVGLACKTLTFQVTDDCNLACTYCYQTNKGTRVMKFEDAKKFVESMLGTDDKITDYLANDDGSSQIGVIIDFIGGEPLLQVDLIDQIIDYFMERCIELDHPWQHIFCASMSSNGYLYTDPNVQRFLNKHQHHLSYSITVDGTKELHDACRRTKVGNLPTYDEAIHAALDYKARGNYLGSKITFAPENIPYAYECMKQMVLDEYSDIFSNVVFEDVWKLEHATLLYNQMKDFADWYLERYDPHQHYISYLENNIGHPMLESDNNNWCGGTGNMLAMDPDGFYYPCIRYMESSVGTKVPPYRIGHVNIGIGKTEDHEQKVKCLNCITRRSQNKDECFNCVLAQGCAWCSGYNYQCTGNPDEHFVTICDMHKGRILTCVYFWNTWVKKSGDKEKVLDLWVPRHWAVPIVGEKEYDMLVSLTEEVGGFVNKDGWEQVTVPERHNSFKGYEDLITPIK